jgi:hypothetical protein
MKSRLSGLRGELRPGDILLGISDFGRLESRFRWVFIVLRLHCFAARYRTFPRRMPVKSPLPQLPREKRTNSIAATLLCRQQLSAMRHLIQVALRKILFAMDLSLRLGSSPISRGRSTC